MSEATTHTILAPEGEIPLLPSDETVIEQLCDRLDREIIQRIRESASGHSLYFQYRVENYWAAADDDEKTEAFYDALKGAAEEAFRLGLLLGHALTRNEALDMEMSVLDYMQVFNDANQSLDFGRPYREAM